MIKVSVTMKAALCSKTHGEYITSGEVGKEVEFDFSDDWSGYAKTAVFEGCGVVKDRLLTGDSCTIPPECIVFPGGALRCGIYGVRGDLVTPTIYCEIGKIVRGADPSGDESTDPSLPVWAQLWQLIGDIDDLNTEDKSSLVAAINEAISKGASPEAIAAIVEKYLREHPVKVEEKDPTVPAWAKEKNKPAYTATEVGALPADTKIPNKTSDLTNDSGFITGYTESDPTVPAWAKEKNKPSYTKSEVGLGNVDNVKQYSASNPPPYPVSSVNGQTGAVNLSASDVGARPSTWMPSASDVGARPASWMPTAQDVGALPNTYTPPNQTAEQVGADPAGTADSKVSAHNTKNDAHNDIRLLIAALTNRLDALANSDDDTLDQMAEVVAYIKDNRGLIEQITTGKVSVSDIIDNLTTNVTNKPLSAAQGVALKALVDGLSTGKLDASALASAINTALAQAKASGAFDGKDGGHYIPSVVQRDSTTMEISFEASTGGMTPVESQDITLPSGATGRRGTGLLPITTAPSSYSTAVNGLTPTYRISLATVKEQAVTDEVFAGDTLRYSYYHYPVIYVDASYVYCRTRVNIRGAAGTTPVAGTDYFTEADKTAMVAAVKAEFTIEDWTFTLKSGGTVTKKVVLD